ncbi:TnpV protein [Faecalibacillus sp. MSK20_93]|uniref:TnpV protein n=2 Tax=Coprobacillaceae TaxID=2810280 RepID=UPI0009E84172|nr:TnpV protein [bacterium MSK20_81]MCB8548937.1 TnpV protein [Faecalibacillus sp. MSK20_93]
MSITYSQVEDYQFPNLKMDKTKITGKYAMMRRAYLKENQPGHLFALMSRNQLNTHLQQIQVEAEMMMEQLMEQMLIKNPAPDKKTNQMAWVGHMNSLKEQVEEIILTQLIYN